MLLTLCTSIISETGSTDDFGLKLAEIDIYSSFRVRSPRPGFSTDQYLLIVLACYEISKPRYKYYNPKYMVKNLHNYKPLEARC